MFLVEQRKRMRATEPCNRDQGVAEQDMARAYKEEKQGEVQHSCPRRNVPTHKRLPMEEHSRTE